MPSYNLLFDHTAADSSPIEFTTAITNPVLVIQCENLTQTNKPWVRAGWVQAVSSTAIGNVRGQAQRVTFGLQEFSLVVPKFPYHLRFIPKDWVKAWHLKVWEREIWIPPNAANPGEWEGGVDLNLIYRKQLDLEAKIDAL
jgi:hypothetical protein